MILKLKHFCIFVIFTYFSSFKFQLIIEDVFTTSL